MQLPFSKALADENQRYQCQTLQMFHLPYVVCKAVRYQADRRIPLAELTGITETCCNDITQSMAKTRTKSPSLPPMA